MLMKRFFLLFLMLPLGLFSQEVPDTLKTWNFQSLFSLNFTQISLTNWVAGGQSSTAGVGILSVRGNYKRDNILWENSLDLGYGIIDQEDGSQKTDDKIDLNSKLGLKQSETLYYSLLFNFRTQFAPGYKYPNTEDAISNFLAPAYLTLGLGLDYKPHKDLSLFFSPATAKMTIVNDDELSAQGAFGVDPGESTRMEVGAYVKMDLNTELMENVTVNNKIGLFSNYLDNPQNIDINWDLMVNMKINDFLSANLITNLIYDDDIKVPLDDDDDGDIDRTGRRIQFKEMFGLGLNLKF